MMGLLQPRRVTGNRARVYQHKPILLSGEALEYLSELIDTPLSYDDFALFAKTHGVITYNGTKLDWPEGNDIERAMFKPADIQALAEEITGPETSEKTTRLKWRVKKRQRLDALSVAIKEILQDAHAEGIESPPTPREVDKLLQKYCAQTTISIESLRKRINNLVEYDR